MAAVRMVLCLIMLVFSPRAWATFGPVTYCVEYSVSYTDGAAGDFLTGSTVPAHGVLVRFVRPDGSYFGVYADTSGANDGCATATLDDQVLYTVKAIRQAHVNDNYIVVNNDTGATYASTIAYHQPTLNQTYYPTALGVTGPINVIAAGGEALLRHNAGLSGETFEFRMRDCPDSDPPTSCSGANYVNISTTAGDSDFKFVILHEMGHMVVSYTNGHNGSGAADGNANYGACSPLYVQDAPDYYAGHQQNSKEYTSMAAKEGIAHFWAAVSLNDDSAGNTTDCEFYSHYSPDWNLNQANDVDDVQQFSCEDGSGLPSGHDAGYDYLGNYCLGSGAIHNRATEYDILRLFWDMRTNEAVSVVDLFDIVNHANPHTWTVDGVGTGSSYPASRLSSGANDVGGSTLQGKWDNQAALNGINP